MTDSPGLTENHATGAALDAVAGALRQWRAGVGEPFVLGVCGAQGSGKSTLSAALAGYLRRQGLRVAVLSLDDIYLSRARRADLAETVHPMFATRGVPGTHDVALGLRILDAVKAGRDVVLPRFDKATDDLAPRTLWTAIDGPLDVLVFEGWCVGARPEKPAALDEPINALEAVRDPAGVWRRAVNAALADDYAALFSHIDRLVMLAAPDFQIVERWRIQQEADLRARLVTQGGAIQGGAGQGGAGQGGAGRAMADDEIRTFIQHYERLTRHILLTMPAYADLVLRLDEQRRLAGSGPA